MESYPVSTIKTNYPTPSYDYPAYCPALGSSLDTTHSILSSSASALAHLVDKTADVLVGKTIKEWIYKTPYFSPGFIKRISYTGLAVPSFILSLIHTCRDWLTKDTPFMHKVIEATQLTHITKLTLPITILTFGLLSVAESFKIALFTLPYFGYKVISSHPAIWGGMGAFLGLETLYQTTCQEHIKEVLHTEEQLKRQQFLESLSPEQRNAYEAYIQNMNDRMNDYEALSSGSQTEKE